MKPRVEITYEITGLSDQSLLQSKTNFEIENEQIKQDKIISILKEKEGSWLTIKL